MRNSSPSTNGVSVVDRAEALLDHLIPHTREAASSHDSSPETDNASHSDDERSREEEATATKPEAGATSEAVERADEMVT